MRCTYCTLGDPPGCESCLAPEPEGEPAPTIVHRIVHLPTGRFYCGKHRLPDGWEDPFEDDSYMGSGYKLRRLLEKHPAEEFRKNVLAVCPTEEAALELESGLVGPEAVANPKSLNLCERGRAPIGLSEESQERRREANRRAARVKFDTDHEYRARVAQAARAMARRRSKNAAWRQATADATRRPAMRAKKSANAKAQWRGMSYEERTAFVARAAALQRTPEGRARCREKSKRVWENLTAEQRAAQRSYWTSMIPEERSAEMRRRAAVAKRRKREVAVISLALVLAAATPPRPRPRAEPWRG